MKWFSEKWLQWLHAVNTHAIRPHYDPELAAILRMLNWAQLVFCSMALVFVYQFWPSWVAMSFPLGVIVMHLIARVLLVYDQHKAARALIIIGPALMVYLAGVLLFLDNATEGYGAKFLFIGILPLPFVFFRWREYGWIIALVIMVLTMLFSFDAANVAWNISGLHSNINTPTLRLLCVITALVFVLFGFGYFKYISWSAQMLQRRQVLATRRANAEMKQALDELRSTQQQLVQGEKFAAMGLLISNIAHELNSPLGVINAAANMIGKEGPPVLHRYVTTMALEPPDVFEYYQGLLVRGIERNFRSLSTREERLLRKQVQQSYAQAGHELTADELQVLYRTGLWTATPESLAQLQNPHAYKLLALTSDCLQLLQAFYSTNLAATKTTQVVRKLKALLPHNIHAMPAELSPQSMYESLLTVVARNQDYLTGIATHVHVSDELPPLLATPEDLDQLWTQLLLNAIQALGTKGNITIAATVQGGMGQISFTDDGPGIALAVRDRLFQPLVTTKLDGQGSGLGLYLCAQIVQRLQGKIDVESEPGHTVFTVHLPLALQAYANAQVPVAAY